jgi:hypothetical protein
MMTANLMGTSSRMRRRGSALECPRESVDFGGFERHYATLVLGRQLKQKHERCYEVGRWVNLL